MTSEFRVAIRELAKLFLRFRQFKLLVEVLNQQLR